MKTPPQPKPIWPNPEAEVQTQSDVNSSADYGTLLIELESNTGWNAATDQWKGRRDSWISVCNSQTQITDKAD